jgi:hypothetical protein
MAKLSEVQCRDLIDEYFKEQEKQIKKANKGKSSKGGNRQ